MKDDLMSRVNDRISICAKNRVEYDGISLRVGTRIWPLAASRVHRRMEGIMDRAWVRSFEKMNNDR